MLEEGHLVKIAIHDDIKEQLKFIEKVYVDDQSFKNNKAGLIGLVCDKNGEFYKNTVQRIISVKDAGNKAKYAGNTFCQCVLICHKTNPKALMVAFFEAKRDANLAVDLMMDYAANFAKELGCIKLEISLDGHCNNSVGFLLSEKSEYPTFGASYNPQYYHDYFDNGYEKIYLASYSEDAIKLNSKVMKDLSYFKDRPEAPTLEYADFSSKGFERTMKRYTDLNNEIFCDHRYYFKREYAEDCQLFYEMRMLLNLDNLIFAVKDGTDIGFILWYPDFNELVSPRKQAGVLTFLKYKLLRRFPKQVKVVEIGVLPKLHGSNTILLLFAKAISCAIKNYPGVTRVLSSWILDENVKSRRITTRFMDNVDKRYVAYEKLI